MIFSSTGSNLEEQIYSAIGVTEDLCNRGIDASGMIKEIASDMGPFAIESNGSLVFEKDVDKNALQCISRITVKAGTVKVPKAAYAQFLIKTKIQGKLDKY